MDGDGIEHQDGKIDLRLGEHDMVRRVDLKRRCVCEVLEVLWSGSVPCGAEIDEPLWTRKEGQERAGQMSKTVLKLAEGEVPDRTGKGWNVEGEREE